MRPDPSPFIVRVPEIPPEGLTRALDLTGSFLASVLEGTEANAGSSTARVELQLHKTGHEVVARGQLEGELIAVCSRCAGEARVTLDEAIEVVYVPRGQESEPTDPEAIAEGPDLVPYDNDQIDLAETLREEILLALPIAPLCEETCRGLCARCGADLNEGPCACPEEPRDDRWAALRNLKIQ